MSHEIRQQATDRILNALANGLVPWARPWLGHRNDGLPTNALTSLPFRGVNFLLLSLAGFRSKWWATQRCWRAFGFQVNSHQQGVTVFHGKPDNLKSQTVFNAEQVEGSGVERYLVGDTRRARLPDYEAAERAIAATGADIRHVPGYEAAYYRLPDDYIVLPLKDQFESGPFGLPAYYSTVLHELCHWAEGRLRWLADPLLSVKERYAIGECRAEIGSAFLGAHIGIPFPVGMVMNHTKFVRTWMKVMQADNTFIFRVAEAASEAAEFILSFSQKSSAVAQMV